MFPTAAVPQAGPGFTGDAGLDSIVSLNENDYYYNIYKAVHKAVLAMYVCVCNAVTEDKIRQAVAMGARSMRQLKTKLGIASNCRKCAPYARDILLCRNKPTTESNGSGR